MTVIGGQQALVLVVDHQAIVAPIELGNDAGCERGVNKPMRRILRATVHSAELARRQKLHFLARRDGKSTGRDGGRKLAELGGITFHAVIVQTAWRWVKVERFPPEAG